MATSRGETQVATASYIEHMLAELRSMSSQMDAPFLAYLLEMAMIEAGGLASKDRQCLPLTCEPNAEELARMYFAGQLD